MTIAADLIERLRTHWESQRKAREADAKYDACCVDLGDEAADALEAQAREIRQADERGDDALRRVHDLEARLAAAERERDEIKQLWFADADPRETRFASEFAVMEGGK